MALAFVRDSMRRELDFVVVRRGKPVFAVECQTGEQDLSRNIAYFSARTSIPRFYQVHLGRRDQEIAACRARILPFAAMAEVLQV